jgi:hypothetical protein
MLLAALAISLPSFAQSKQKATGGGLVEDRGKLRAYLDGQAVGTEEFSISRSGSEWLCRGSTEIKIPSAASEEVSSELRLSAEGSPTAYQFNTKGSKKAGGAATFSAGSATMELRTEGAQGFTQTFQFESQKIVVLDNNLYHHYVVLARLYDWNAKGAQTFSVLIPQDLTPGTITVEWAGPNQIEGSKFDVLRVKSADLDLELWVANGRLERILVPTAKVEVKRE